MDLQLANNGRSQGRVETKPFPDITTGSETGWRSRRRLRERPGIQGVVIAARFSATNRSW
jgi:hypothetical protein